MHRANLCEAVRQRLKRYPPPHQSHYGVVPLPPERGIIPLGDRQSIYEQAIAAMGRVDAYAASLPSDYFISRILPRREAISSSAIENTYSTLDELLAAEETDDESASVATKQVRSYAQALDDIMPLAKQNGDEIFTRALIEDLHRRVMKDDADFRGKPGEVRNTVAWIGPNRNLGDSIYNPAPPDDVAVCLEDSLDYLRNDDMQCMQQGLLTRMAIAHAHFEAVHPFSDGNGRVGRLLLPLMMAAAGRTPLYLSPYIDTRKNGYGEALQAAQQRLNVVPLIAFLAEAVIATLTELDATRTALSHLEEQWRARRKFRARSAAERSLSVLAGYPVMTVNRMAKVLAVSVPAAWKCVNQLVEAGILHEQTGYTRNRVYVADDVLAIINRPFGAEAMSLL